MFGLQQITTPRGDLDSWDVWGGGVFEGRRGEDEEGRLD
jgi:hypothetical protein